MASTIVRKSVCVGSIAAVGRTAGALRRIYRRKSGPLALRLVARVSTVAKVLRRAAVRASLAVRITVGARVSKRAVPRVRLLTRVVSAAKALKRARPTQTVRLNIGTTSGARAIKTLKYANGNPVTLSTGANCRVYR